MAIKVCETCKGEGWVPEGYGRVRIGKTCPSCKALDMDISDEPKLGYAECEGCANDWKEDHMEFVVSPRGTELYLCPKCAEKLEDAGF